MGNLYKIVFKHFAPKDSEEGIKEYVVADNEDQIFDHIVANHSGGWEDRQEDEPYDIYNDDFEIIGKESFKEKMMRLKGEYHDEGVDVSDAYYGVTIMGWEKIENTSDGQIKTLLELNIAVDIRDN